MMAGTTTVPLYRRGFICCIILCVASWVVLRHRVQTCPRAGIPTEQLTRKPVSCITVAAQRQIFTAFPIYFLRLRYRLLGERPMCYLGAYQFNHNQCVYASPNAG